VRLLAEADLILHGGDVATAEVLSELGKLGPLEAVFGNADEPALKESLPKERVVEIEGVRIGMVHIPGSRSGREDRLVGRFPGCQAVVYGHTHIPQVERHSGVWILNPGSPTERRRALGRSMLILEVTRRTIRPRLVDLS
jgi:putative phosphoesterase